MISITIRAEKTSLRGLQKQLLPYFASPEDISKFTDAMIQTKQIEQIGNFIFFPKVKVVEKRVEGWATVDNIAGGSRPGRIRWAFTQPIDWKWGVPQNFEFTEVIVSGKHYRVPKSLRPPFLKPWITMKPRPSGSWRSSIPAEILKAFPGLKYGDKVKIRTDETIKNYYAELTLWGYVLNYQITYDYKSPTDHRNDRHLELIGTDFVNEFTTGIILTADILSNSIDQLMVNLLAGHFTYKEVIEQRDEDYTLYFDKEITGFEFDKPLLNQQYKTAKVKLWGQQGLELGDMGTTIKKWKTIYPMDHLPDVDDFQEE